MGGDLLLYFSCIQRLVIRGEYVRYPYRRQCASKSATKSTVYRDIVERGRERGELQ